MVRIFPHLSPNTDRYSVSLRIHSECGKIQTRKNSVFEHFSRSGRWKKVEFLLKSAENKNYLHYATYIMRKAWDLTEKNMALGNMHFIKANIRH